MVLYNQEKRKENKTMTIRELYEWAKTKECLDYELVVTESDGGCYFLSNRETNIYELEIHEQYHEVEI